MEVMVSLTSRPLYLRRNSPRYSVDRRLRGPQSRSRRCEEEKNLARPTFFNSKKLHICPICIYVFHIILQINTDFNGLIIIKRSIAVMELQHVFFAR
jgi:hypothetical protein